MIFVFFEHTMFLFVSLFKIDLEFVTPVITDFKLRAKRKRSAQIEKMDLRMWVRHSQRWVAALTIKFLFSFLVCFMYVDVFPVYVLFACLVLLEASRECRNPQN